VINELASHYAIAMVWATFDIAGTTTVLKYFCLFSGLFDGVSCHFQQYFRYIVAVSFIGRLRQVSF
jgi:hypothetical protein